VPIPVVALRKCLDCGNVWKPPAPASLLAANHGKCGFEEEFRILRANDQEALALRRPLDSHGYCPPEATILHPHLLGDAARHSDHQRAVRSEVAAKQNTTIRNRGFRDTLPGRLCPFLTLTAKGSAWM
jgi:hypothetical protein